MESFEHIEAGQALSAEMVRVRNDLQSLLILEGAPAEKGQARDMHIDEWFRSGKIELFEEVFNQLKNDNPSLVEDWGDIGKREEIIQEAKKRLGGAPSHSVAA